MEYSRVNRRNFLRLGGSATVVASAGCLGTGSGGDRQVTIGGVLPLTQSFQNQGQASRRGILLAADEVADEYGLELSTPIEDDQCSAQAAASAQNKLINQNGASFIVGSICDDATAAMIPISQENEVVQITPGSTSPDISDAGGYIFRFWFSEAQLGEMIANHMREQGYERLAIVHIQNAWGTAQQRAVSSSFEAAGGSVVSTQAIQSSTSSYGPILSTAEDANPDCYYVGTHPSGFDSLMERMGEQNVDKQVFSHGGVVGGAISQGLADQTYEGVVCGFAKEPKQSFERDFEDRFGEPPGVTAASAYDAVHVLGMLIDREGTTDPATIEDALYEVDGYDGASGELSVDDNGDTHRPLQILVVEDGELVPLN
jgi:branched-chain amino acid transport system substrate-binding protein